jgi:hypothetical protein
MEEFLVVVADAEDVLLGPSHAEQVATLSPYANVAREDEQFPRGQ